MVDAEISVIFAFNPDDDFVIYFDLSGQRRLNDFAILKGEIVAKKEKKAPEKKAGKVKAATKKTKKALSTPKSAKSVTKKAAGKKAAPKPASKSTPKKVKKSAPQAAPQQIVKSPLTPKELDYFRQLLLDKLHQILGDVDWIEKEALRKSRTENTGDLSNMPIHMADIGTDNYEQEFSLGLMDSERKLVREILDALKRIDKGTYGICEGTGEPIPKARLEANPWARYCVEYASLIEQGKAPIWQNDLKWKVVPGFVAEEDDYSYEDEDDEVDSVSPEAEYEEEEAEQDKEDTVDFDDDLFEGYDEDEEIEEDETEHQ